MAPDTALLDAVDDFVETVGSHLRIVCEALPSLDAEQLGRDVALDAFNLAAGLIEADGRLTDEELGALIVAFAARLTSSDLAHATPETVRASGLLDGRAEALGEPSPLFHLLLDADRRDGTAHARAYRDRAVSLAHVVASLDDLPTDDELRAVERLRAALDEALADAAARPATVSPTPGAPAPAAAPVADAPARPLAEVMADLDGLVGLEGVKREVRLVTDLLQVQKLRKERGLKVKETSRHLVFTGNPGTGKTTVARLLAEIYRALGVVARGHLVETDRSQLVAGFVGQTAPRVVAAFDQADEGVLLIDEAQALARGGEGDFGKEAIDTLVKLVEDRRDRVVVIVAGYHDEMQTFIDANPGLRSRFPRTIRFSDYSDEELVRIVEGIADDSGYRLVPEARTKVLAWFQAQPRTKGFGNGRTARNLVEDVVARHAERVVDLPDPSDDTLSELLAADIPGPTDGPVSTPDRPSPDGSSKS